MPPEAVAELERQCELEGEPVGPDGFRAGHPCPALSLYVRELSRYDCAIARQRGELDPIACDEERPVTVPLWRRMLAR